MQCNNLVYSIDIYRTVKGKKGNAMKVRDVRRQKMGRRKKMYEDKRDNVRVPQSPEKRKMYIL